MSRLPLRRDREENNNQKRKSQQEDDTDDVDEIPFSDADESSEAAVDTDDDEPEEFFTEAQQAERKKLQEQKRSKKDNSTKKRSEDESDPDETEEEKQTFFRKNNGQDDLGNEDEDDNSDLIRRVRQQELINEEKNTARNKPPTLSALQLESIKKILSVLKFPDETPSFALTTRIPLTISLLLKNVEDAKTREQKQMLMDAVTNFEMETALTSSYSKQISEESMTTRPIMNMTRDELLLQFIDASCDSTSSLPDIFLLSWSEIPPKTSSKFCCSSPEFASTYLKSIFGPVSVEELNNWKKKGFFEKKQGFILRLNESKRTSKTKEERGWFKVAKSTSDDIFH